MSLHNLHKLVQTGTGGAGGWWGPAGSGGGGAGTNSYVLTQQRLEEWEWYRNFITMNPDLQERWEQHKTYEILKNEHVER